MEEVKITKVTDGSQKYKIVLFVLFFLFVIVNAYYVFQWMQRMEMYMQVIANQMA